MSLKTSMANTRQQALLFWSARNARERRILVLGAAALLAALVYLLLISPAQTGLARYRRGLPELRQQVAQLQGMAQEAASLPQGEVAAPPPVSRETVEASLARRGLKAQSLTVVGDTARLQLKDVSFTSLLDWIADSRSAAQMNVSEANLTAQSQPDIVSGSIALRQQRGQ